MPDLWGMRGLPRRPGGNHAAPREGANVTAFGRLLTVIIQKPSVKAVESEGFRMRSCLDKEVVCGQSDISL